MVSSRHRVADSFGVTNVGVAAVLEPVPGDPMLGEPICVRLAHGTEEEEIRTGTIEFLLRDREELPVLLLRGIALDDLSIGAIVCLERSPPSRRYALRRARGEDRELLYRIKADALRQYAIERWGPWDDAAQRERFEAGFDPRRFQLIVKSDPIGLLESEQTPDGLRIHNIALIEAWRNRGIGTEVLSRLALAEPVIRLRVLKNNPARRFYERLGFRAIGDPDDHWWEMIRDARAPAGS